MNTIRTVIRMYTRGNAIWFFLPWIVLVLQFLVALIVIRVVLLFAGGRAPFYPGGLLTICVIMLIGGILNLTDTFPFALGFGVRRTDYVLGTTVMALAISALTAVLWLLGSLGEHVTGGWNIDLHYFHLPYFNDGSFIEQFWVYFAVLANIYFLGFVTGSISQRFGRIGTVIFLLTTVLLLSLLSLVLTYVRWWGAFFAWVSQFTAYELTLGLLPLTALYLLASYLLLRRAAA